MEEKVSDKIALVLMAKELKNGRVLKKLSLDEASRMLSIQCDYLEKIEAADFSFLSGVYVFAYIKAYARAMGVGNDDVLEQCRKELHFSGSLKGNMPDTNAESETELTAFSAIMRVALIIVFILIVLLGIWYLLEKSHASPVVPAVQYAPSRKVLMVPVLRHYDYFWVNKLVFRNFLFLR